MQVLSAKLALTGALATLLWAVPVSIDLGRPGSANTNMFPALGIGLKIDSAQARIGRPATAPRARCTTVVVPNGAVRRCARVY